MKRLVLFVGAAFLFNAPVALADTISIPEFDTKAYCKKMAGMAGWKRYDRGDVPRS